MARALTMPEVAANAGEAVLGEWLVEPGIDVSGGTAIATIETDKALVDIEAEESCRILLRLVEAGTTVEVGAPIAVLGDPGESLGDPDELLATLGISRPGGPPAAAPATEPGDGPEPERPEPTADGTAVRRFSSPLARRIARAAGLALDDVAGTGPRNRILRRDVELALATHRAPAPVTSPPPATAPAPVTNASTSAYTDEPHSRLRRAIAQRLTASKQEAPHFYLRAQVRVDRLLALRAELNDGAAVRVSVNDFVVKAVALAHAAVPEMNVIWTEDAVRRFTATDIAIAVATERGLVTPVVRDVGRRTVTDIALAVRDVAERAREGRLRQEELEGGSISVTNLGMYGVEEFAAIINPPHAAILAVGAVRPEPIVVDGALEVGQVMRVTLSVDHRPVDGVVGARWLTALVAALESPVNLLR